MRSKNTRGALTFLQTTYGQSKLDFEEVKRRRARADHEVRSSPSDGSSGPGWVHDHFEAAARLRGLK